jgi:enoyl-CoA hydratase/carnithine racemase
LSPSVFAALEAAWQDIDQDPQIRAVVFTGTGRGFCAGADMVGRSERAGTDADERSTNRVMPNFTARHCKVYKPVITAVNGVCAGAGLHFVCDSEIVIAAQSATFTDTHVNVGQMSALEPIGLSRRIPLGAVLRMVSLGKSERMSAQRAYELGMVSEVVADDVLMDRALQLAEQVGEGSPDTLRKSLQMIWDSLDMGLEEALAEGWTRIQQHYAHPDGVEGPSAFVQKRTPDWTVERRG